MTIKDRLNSLLLIKKIQMGNKRSLKKGLNEMVFDVVDECYFIQIADSKKIEASEKLITEVADFQDDLLSKMNKAKGKAAFRAIYTEIETKSDYFVDALNTLNK
jgi:hypothetical protein